jgi:hypothetical protein
LRTQTFYATVDNAVGRRAAECDFCGVRVTGFSLEQTGRAELLMKAIVAVIRLR